MSPLPWLLIGDFNEVLHAGEHDGVGQRSQSQIASFRSVVDDCALLDLGYTGIPWTFEHKVAGGSYTRVRLDRVLACSAWTAQFPRARVDHLTAGSSDHVPIILHPHGEAWVTQRQHVFRYETMWESHDQLHTKVANDWGECMHAAPWRKSRKSWRCWPCHYLHGTSLRSGAFISKSEP